MAALNKEMMLLVIQYLGEENLKETMHKMEQESGLFFNLKYFEEKILAGELDEAEKYLGGFTRISESRNSMKMFFEIRKQKYFEALDKHDKATAVDILVKDLKIFSTSNGDLYKEITHLITLNNFREKEELSQYGDTKATRTILMGELKKLIDTNPSLKDKLEFPTIQPSRLRQLVNQSLNWQHQLCRFPSPHPDIKTLFTDHFCLVPRINEPCSPTLALRPAADGPSHLSFAVAPLRLVPTAPTANSVAAWLANANPSSSSQSPAAVAGSSLPGPSNGVSLLQYSRTLPNLTLVDHQSPDLDPRMRLFPNNNSLQAVQAAYTFTSPPMPKWFDELPRTVFCKLHQGSTVTSMEFHPSRHSILAVGCVNGEISLWETKLREMMITRPFKIWKLSNCSVQFQAASLKELMISVNRVSWSPDASFIGIAFAKHLVHLYSYQVPNGLQQQLEIDAHDGAVNDIAFTCPENQLCIVTCGDDKLIKVWDLDGHKIHHLEGHVAPVCSLLPRSKENIQFLFSTSADGKVRAWMYDDKSFHLEYDAPGKCPTTLIYSADGTRLFSCGTSNDGDIFLVEWNENDGSVKRTYSGLTNKAAGPVQFDAAKNRFLAAGADSQIKFWDVDSTNVLIEINADGGLSNLPRLKFNKKGNLLAVSTADGGVKILANADGFKSMRHVDASDPKGGVNVIIARNMEINRSFETIHSLQCQIVTMPERVVPNKKAIRLLYTNDGACLLALGSRGSKKLWKWTPDESNPTGKATASVVPVHWTPINGIRLTDEFPTTCDSSTPCLDISKNDNYAIASYGGEVALFNMVSFRVLCRFEGPPPAATFLAFNPQDNNIIAVGMENSEIHIFNVRSDERVSKLKGHCKYITGIAFSLRLSIMVSSGADSKVVSWFTGPWFKKKSVILQMPGGGHAHLGETKVQFHIDQTKLLVCHDSQIAIYDASKMELIHQWPPQDGLSGTITSAAYNCNGQIIYATFSDGNIGIFDAENLHLRYRIDSSAYLSPSNSQNIYPIVVAAHPEKPYQLAIGLNDGYVKVIEPINSAGWLKQKVSVVKMDIV
ncbi:protein TPR1-like [Vicia villosa]|uniref:protein TPR1-like n=1 Tax=Vicia villosa TaxID=3911 RepID=UPI00273BF10B|nr:protein TPR1-like [Vicia villosa]